MYWITSTTITVLQYQGLLTYHGLQGESSFIIPRGMKILRGGGGRLRNIFDLQWGGGGALKVFKSSFFVYYVTHAQN